MFTLIRYNKDNNHYAMIVFKRGYNITDGDLFENGEHKKAFLWQNGNYDEIKKMIFDNLKNRQIRVEPAYEYKGMPWEHCYIDKLRDLSILKAYPFYHKCYKPLND